MHPDLSSVSTRRRWVKQFLLGSAAALAGPAWTGRVLAEISSTGPGAGVLRLKPAAFPVLSAPGGSVQLKFISYLKPLTLNRVEENRFVTLDTNCTHQGCTVGRYLPDDKCMTCPCHGSRYDLEGRVFRDPLGNSTEPAPDDLGRYETAYDPVSKVVSIAIPTLALHVSAVSVHRKGPGESIRLKLVFPVSFGAIYEIFHHSSPTAPPVRVNFSKTPDGAADRARVGPEEEGDFTAYVDAKASQALFSVGVRLTKEGF